MNVFAVIMAGGEGTRLWPISRKKTPKQLINLSGRDLMINETIDRLIPAVTREAYIVTGQAQAERLCDAVQARIPRNHVLIEPAARNTAACIGFAAVEVLKKHGDGVMVVVPSDSYIRDDAEYARVLNLAVQKAAETEALVTIGITPSYPATGYGYIEYDQLDPADAKPVLKFVEKPDYMRALQYITQGNYVWNSGVFVWKVSVILEHLKACLPELYARLMKISDHIGLPDEARVIDRIYPELPSISVDYGVLEKVHDILVIPADFGWNDVGSLDMLSVLHEQDARGNTLIGDVMQMDTDRSIVYSKEKLTAVIGMDGVIVINTPDVTLICPKERAQDVKKIVEELKRKGRDEVL